MVWAFDLALRLGRDVNRGASANVMRDAINSANAALLTVAKIRDSRLPKLSCVFPDDLLRSYHSACRLGSAKGREVRNYCANSCRNSGCVAGLIWARLRFSLTWAVWLMPIKAVVMPGAERVN